MTANPSFIEKYVNIDYNSVEKKITAFIAEAVINSNLNGLVHPTIINKSSNAI